MCAQQPSFRSFKAKCGRIRHTVEYATYARLSVAEQWLLEVRQNIELNTDRLLPQYRIGMSMNVVTGVWQKTRNSEAKCMKSLKLGI